jgi:pheophorbidase
VGEMGFKQHHFVLVHGAGHGAWCWYKSVATLEKAGHRVTALDLVGAGDSKVEPDDVASLDQYSQTLIDFFKFLPDHEKVITSSSSKRK